MLDLPLYLDAILWVLLLTGFFISYNKNSFVCAIVLLLFLAKGIDSVFSETSFYRINANFFLFFSLGLALFFARSSPNYRWLLTGMILLKIVDISISDWLLQQKSLFYLIVAIMDLGVILLISHRAMLARWLEKQNIYLVSCWSRDCMGQFGFSFQEMLLVAMYWTYIVIGLLTFTEDIIYVYTDFKPSFFYTIYAPVKLVINLAELLLIVCIASGHARGIYSGRRIA